VAGFQEAMAVLRKSDGAPLFHAKIFNHSSEKYSIHQPSPVEVVLLTIRRSSLTYVKEKCR